MEKTEKKQRFVELRVNGLSYASIEKELHISRGTCSAWERELADAIFAAKREVWDGLIQEYGLAKEARVRRMGEQLRKIQDALENVDLTAILPERLLDMQLKYIAALSKEYIPPPPCAIDARNRPGVLAAMEDLLGRVRGGETSVEQAKIELEIYNQIHGQTQAMDNEATALKMFGEFGR